ncbi:MAG: ABC transporter ATP-binding protein [Frankiales bacterium]|nr:ABC transporter ATP-binding protein [Frankiales bacterium]
MSAAVEVRGARKSYGQLVALDGVDLQVQPGQLHGLLGQNGAGKTTLLRLLLGLVRPDAGTVQVLGAAAVAARDGVAGFVDAPRAWPYLTGRRNLVLLARLDGAGEGPARVDGVLEQVGLTGAADSKVAGWSTGQRQRLGLAAALLRRPRLLVLDEPTSGLDPVGVQDIHAVLRRLQADGTTVVLSSHNLAEVAALCTDVTVVARGRVRYAGSLAALTTSLPMARHRLRSSDDPRACAIGGSGVTMDADGLVVLADQPALDAYVLALGAQGIAVRALATAEDPLTRAFLELTA